MAILEVTTGSGTMAGFDALWTVHNSVYTAGAFELEQEKIFRRRWVFVCHESEVKQPGQYVTRSVAGDPLIIVRTDDGAVKALHNVCRHRGSLVAIDERGTTPRFQCPYHHWTYGTDGALIGVPGENAYTHCRFDKSELGLLQARCETLSGLVFVCLDDGAPLLTDYVGPDLAAILSRPLDDLAYEVFHRETWVMKANWKIFAENQRDGYHVPFVHSTFLAKGSPPQPYHLFPGGHALQLVTWDSRAVDAETWAETSKFPLPGFEPGEGWLVNIFPDFLVMARSNVVEIMSQTPLNHEESLFEVRVLGVAGDNVEQRASRERSWEVWLQTQQPEDRLIMEAQQRGLVSRSMRVSLIARGEPATAGVRGDDNRLRQFWEPWRAMMGLSENKLPDA